MALKATLTADDFSSLADPIKEHYKQEGDAYVLETDIVVEDVTGLKSALKSEREARAAAEKKYREDIVKYKDIDPAKYQEAMAKLQEIEDKRLAEAGEFERLKQGQAEREKQAADAVRNELTPKLGAAESKLKQVMIARELQTEFAKQGGIPAAVESFVELAQRGVSLETSDDDFKVVVADGRGNDIAEYVENLKATDAFGVFFQADGTAGSGTSSQTKHSGGKALTRSTMSDTEKALYIRANSLAAYNKLPE